MSGSDKNLQLNSSLSEFIFPIRVYYEDTDAGGIVYYANYLKFFERARSEWLRHLGIEQDVLLQQHHVGFVVRKVDMDNHMPARFNELLQVKSTIAKLRKASVEFKQQIINEQQQVLVEVRVVVACVDMRRMKPIAIPAEVQGELSRVN